MLQDIFVGIMCVIVAGVAVWGWWIENGPGRSDPGEGEKAQQEETEGQNRTAEPAEAVKQNKASGRKKTEKPNGKKNRTIKPDKAAKQKGTAYPAGGVRP